MSKVVCGLIIKMLELPKRPVDKYKGLEDLDAFSDITGFF